MRPGLKCIMHNNVRSLSRNMGVFWWKLFRIYVILYNVRIKFTTYLSLCIFIYEKYNFLFVLKLYVELIIMSIELYPFRGDFFKVFQKFWSIGFGIFRKSWRNILLIVANKQWTNYYVIIAAIITRSRGGKYIVRNQMSYD